MSAFVILIDSDANLNQFLDRELGRYGFRVESFADANEVMARSQDLPQLVVLCIDPKRAGWAVCNRLRKSSNLKGIPLIVTSAEATEKDFEDHKKLKTRAEDYLHKPFAADALAQKIGDLIGMPEMADGGIELAIESEDMEVDSEEIQVEVEEDSPAPSSFQGGFQGSSFADDLEDRTRVGVVSFDKDLDLETDAAFAAIGNEPSTMVGQVPPPPDEASKKPGKKDDPFALKDSPFDPPESTAPGPTGDDLDLGLDAVALEAEAHPSRPIGERPRRQSTPMVMSSMPPPELPPAHDAHDDHAADQAMLAELSQLRAERERLTAELEEAKARPAAPAKESGFSREREFLNLREIINKKEKEVLDLRDSVDARDRQLLDGKDKLRDFERRARDLEEKLLGAERDLMAVREKSEALVADKDKAGEREKQTKSRLDDALKQIQRWEQETESWKQKHAAEVAASAERQAELAAKAAADRQRQAEEHEAAKLAAVEKAAEEHARAAAALTEAHTAALQEASQQHAAHLGRVTGELQNALRDKEQQHTDEITGQKARAAQELKNVEQAKNEAVAQLTEAHEAEAAKLRAEHDRAIESADAAAAAALEAAASKHAEALSAAETAHQAAVERALSEAQAKHQAELAAAHDTHASKHKALEEAHADQKIGMQARHSQEVEHLKAEHTTTLGQFETALQERDALLEQQQVRITQLEGQVVVGNETETHLKAQLAAITTGLEAARAELAERDARLAQRDKRIEEMELESTGFQEQILKAYHRIKSDEAAVLRAKKALGIALTVLDESGNGAA